MTTQPKTTRSLRNRQGGFALVVTLSLMTMMLLMVLTLTTLVRINLQTANTSLNTTLARQNALLGAYIGLGMLQKFAGPDQRITTASDLGRFPDLNDQSAILPPGILPGNVLGMHPYSSATAYSVGGTRYWTAVWGHGTKPMSLYSSPPQPVLLTYLVSGNENTPLSANVGTDGSIAAAPSYISYTADTQGIGSTLARRAQDWSPQTFDLFIAGNTTGGSPTSSPKQPATVLAAANSVGTENISTKTAPSSSGVTVPILANVNEQVNYIVVPMVNVTIPSDTGSGSQVNTVGRYAFWVRDEGLKAKYTPTDPYAGLTLGTGSTTEKNQQARYRYMAPQRNGMERMTGFGVSGGANPTSAAFGYAFINSPITYNGTAAARLTKLLEPLQVMLLDGNLSQANPTQPTKYLQQHFHDYTTYSWGVLADTLRGGLRFDLTSAFEPGAGPTAVFADATYGFGSSNPLAGKSILPTGNTTVASTEPNTNGLIGPRTFSNLTFQGIRWDRLKSYYNIATAVSTKLTAPTAAVTMQVGTPLQVAISPVILQARVQFGVYSNFNQQQCISIQSAYVLANPYNFPIIAPAGGLDLGWRISTNTGHEWGLNVATRDGDRGGDHNSGHFVNIFDTKFDTSLGQLGGFAGTPNGANYGWGVNTNGPGYFPILKNPISFSGQNANNPSALDNIGFHITAADSLLMPGEAKIYSIGSRTGSLVSVAGRTTLAGIGGTLPLNTGVAAFQSGFPATDTAFCVAYIADPVSGLPSVQQIPLVIGYQPGYFFLREAGFPSSNTIITSPRTNWREVPVAVTETTPGGEPNIFPHPSWGWITNMYPSTAATLELRLNTSTVVASAVGTNVLTNLVNLDLTGAGLNSNPTNAPFQNAIADSTYRHSYARYGQPSFIGAYYTMMVFPRNQEYHYYKNVITGPGSVTGIPFYPSNALSFRNYADYNLRAVNMALPPFIPFNNFIGGTGSSNPPAGMSSNFMTIPPYARFYDQGGYDFAGLPPPAGFVAGTDFAQGLATPGGWNFGQSPWGYSDEKVAPALGNRYVVLYNLPARTAAAAALLPTPNPAPGEPANGIPDVPIMSIGQLADADVTADDVWHSVGYQPGRAIGNSYFNPYVNRNLSIQDGTGRVNVNAVVTSSQVNNAAIRATGAISGASTPGVGGSSGTNSARSFDISYLMNIALWDRYYFSTLYWGVAPPGNAAGLAVPPANSRLKFNVSWPTNAQLGVVGTSGVLINDPVTNKSMFKAYVPARYLMIDGAFNINSTSVEAWRSVLSAMRNVPYNSSSLGGDASSVGGTPFPRSLPSPATSSGAAVASAPIQTSDSSAGTNDVSYSGFRQLSDYDIDVLAVKIVQQIRARGPFLSLAQFVNRRLQADTTTGPDVRAVSGPLQAAIDMAVAAGSGTFPAGNNLTGAQTSVSGGGSIPASYSAIWKPSSTTIYPDPGSVFTTSVPYPTGSSNPMSRVTGIPAWLTQADILSAIGSIISARSDTFVIRSYGDVLNPLINQGDVAKSIVDDPSKILSRAWCEMVVQRYPDYMDASNDASATTGPINNTAMAASTSSGGNGGVPNPSSTTLAPGGSSFVNATFGRRFRIVSLRWLNPTDI